MYVPLGDLTIKVKPDVGMETADGARVLKLWWGPEPMESDLAEVYRYFLIEASKRFLWADWEPSIWDVRRRAIPIVRDLPSDIGRTVADAAADFLRIWLPMLEQP